MHRVSISLVGVAQLQILQLPYISFLSFISVVYCTGNRKSSNLEISNSLDLDNSKTCYDVQLLWRLAYACKETKILSYLTHKSLSILIIDKITKKEI